MPDPLGKCVGKIEQFDFGFDEVGFVESDVQRRVVVVGNLARLVQNFALQRRQGHGGIEKLAVRSNYSKRNTVIKASNDSRVVSETLPRCFSY